MADAIRFVLEQHGFRAGRYTVGYQSCDDSTAQTGGFEIRKCAANANAFGGAEQLVAVIGPYKSYCAQIEIPILNRAPDGPLAMISPSTRTLGSRVPASRTDQGYAGRLVPDRRPQLHPARPPRGPAGSGPGGPRRSARPRPGRGPGEAGYGLAADVGRPVQESGARARPPDRALRLRRGKRRASARWPNGSRTRDADGVFVVGSVDEGGDKLIRALRSKAGDDVTIHVLDLFGPVPYVLERLGSAAHGIYMSFTDTPPHALDLSPAGERFARDFGYLDNPTPYVLPAAQAAESVLEAIARSDGTRRSRSRPPAGDQGRGRHPGRLPPRPVRRHRPRPDPDLPHNREEHARRAGLRDLRGRGRGPRDHGPVELIPAQGLIGAASWIFSGVTGRRRSSCRSSGAAGCCRGRTCTGPLVGAAPQGVPGLPAEVPVVGVGPVLPGRADAVRRRSGGVPCASGR